MAEEKVGVKAIILSMLMAVLAITIPTAFGSHVDLVTSQGVEKIGSDDANMAGLTGSGVKIAVIDGGFDLNNSEIAGHVDVSESMSFRSDGNLRGDSHQHGTAVAEIIAEIAPDAKLYLFNVANSADLSRAINHIINLRDIDIVSMSVGFPGVTALPDGKSLTSQKINEARNSGILWVNAAGNDAQHHWQGQFYDPDGDGVHNFAANDESNGVCLVAGKKYHFILTWGNRISSTQDFDLYLRATDSENSIIDKSEQNQMRGARPVEWMRKDSSSDQCAHIIIQKRSATTNVNFHLFSYGISSPLQYPIAASSISVPADAKGSFSVGAMHWSNDQLEDYSSQGPTLEPRTKPDISAPSVVDTKAYGVEGFDGTSAAAPHVAGAAALVMQKYPDATADQVQKILESTVYSITR